MRKAIVTMNFLESLPADARRYIWLPTDYLMLTLPNDCGEYTAFEVKRCPQHGLIAHNVALYRPAPEEQP